jgi:glycosyltransferase involved in cell wall biosynthesis
MDARPRMALVHDWLTGMRGGEKCLEVLCRHWPDADLHTLLHTPGRLSSSIERMNIRTSFLQRLPAVERFYRYLLPLMPAAIERFRLAGYDLVVSLSHCVAKAIRPPLGVPHVCYCFTPMRYIWHMRQSYFGSSDEILRLADVVRTPKRVLLRGLLAWLRHWDRETAKRVTHFVAISETVRQRIRECYGRDSAVIYPPVQTDFFTPAKVRRDEYYLVVSAFAPYKRIDLAIAACNRLRRHLLIIGTGQDERRLRAMAGPTIRFAGWQADEVIREHLRRCQALLFPGEEDFGITPVEANACGTPVIAFGRGGATETILPPGQSEEPSGLWFDEQTPEALTEAIRRFELSRQDYSPLACRRQAECFQQERFERELLGFLRRVLEKPGRTLRRAA